MMKTEELAELFLVYLYDMAEAAPHPYFLFSMNEFVPKVRLNNMAELRQALNHLEEKGLIYLTSTDAWGGVSAGITMEGSAFVEKGGETGIIGRYREDPSSAGMVTDAETATLPSQESIESAPPPEPASQNPAPEAPAEVFDAILAEMATAVRTQTTEEPSTTRDVLADIETLRIQLAKGTRNQAVIKGVLDNLSEFPTLAPLARVILRLL